MEEVERPPNRKIREISEEDKDILEEVILKKCREVMSQLNTRKGTSCLTGFLFSVCPR